jgi:hypothetical protein
MSLIGFMIMNGRHRGGLGRKREDVPRSSNSPPPHFALLPNAAQTVVCNTGKSGRGRLLAGSM